ncbi:MAG: lycopene cyclase domain-containing protein [Coraliomargaritaceae bacterium]
MTYLEFLVIFVCLPLFFSLCAKKLFRKTGKSERLPIALMGLVALVYTTPWDNYLIMRGVWTYPVGGVAGVLGYVPIEEYFFMVLQATLAGVLWASWVPHSEYAKLRFSRTGLFMALFVGLVGALSLMNVAGTYMGLILVWACPPLALQWGLGAHVLIKSFKTWAPLWIGLSVYLCMADYYAIFKGIWSITPTTRTGWGIGHLPVEEILFFTLTNLFVLQGLCLWRAWRRDAS